MSLLTYNKLVTLVHMGVINAPLENVSGASIDITLGDEILIENRAHGFIDLANNKSIQTTLVKLDETGYAMAPGQFVLATTVETFNLPEDIVAEYVLKSSLARNGLNHLLAGYCDPHWHSSKLTLELKNECSYHSWVLRPGMKIGQMKFYHVEPVPHDKGYAVKGQYNNQASVTGSGVLK